MSSPSTRERTERTRITSRTIDNVDRLLGALAHDLQVDLGVDQTAHLLDRLIERQALHRLRHQDG